MWVLLMSNIMALCLQTLAARLGLVTERDLAQCCRYKYPRKVCTVLWVLTEIAIAATDLAEGILLSGNPYFKFLGLQLGWNC